MRWSKLFFCFSVSAIFASVAVFYYPPARAQADIALAIDKQPVWNMRAQGKIGEEPMRIDLVKRQGELLFRISYSPVKLLNNRWITLGKSNHLFSNLRLVKRLTNFNDLVHRRERYAFEWDEKVLELFAGIPEKDGVLWFKPRAGLPVNFRAGEFEGLIQYQDPFPGEEIVQVRKLGEVIEQLQDLTRTRNGTPKPLPYLINGSVDTAEFIKDFDQDGISDALEIFWGTDPGSPDTDNDAFLDGDEVNRGYNPNGEGRLTR